jgi:hypothetical protein
MSTPAFDRRHLTVSIDWHGRASGSGRRCEACAEWRSSLVHPPDWIARVALRSIAAINLTSVWVNTLDQALLRVQEQLMTPQPQIE